jgi:hypothetical protein
MSGKATRLTRILGPAVLAALLGAGCADWYADWSDASVAETQLRGDRIALALDAYQRDHLGYPYDLDLLVPKYLPQIQPPAAGEGVWKYKVYGEGARYDLTFEGPSEKHPSFTYSPTTRAWQRKSD